VEEPGVVVVVVLIRGSSLCVEHSCIGLCSPAVFPTSSQWPGAMEVSCLGLNKPECSSYSKGLSPYVWTWGKVQFPWISTKSITIDFKMSTCIQLTSATSPLLYRKRLPRFLKKFCWRTVDGDDASSHLTRKWSLSLLAVNWHCAARN